ncbi:hypothetical protein Bpla01_04670 [Burkholderia plantarii]|nr:hypothetical protein bpln_2g15340 [Burkholderia plantarii]GLZ16937.1 hypothetical protein Bpla01_04670 [Burkholderia plantarii]
MMKPTLKLSLVLLASAAGIAGCVTSGQGRVAVGPGRGSDVSLSVDAAPGAEVAYEPIPTDIYVATAVDTDVVIYRGDTYIWVAGPNGVRHRQFYAHGDHRRDVFRRREELRHVMTNHGGHLPAHAIAAHGPGHGDYAHGPERAPEHAGPAPHGGPEHPGAMPRAGRPAPALPTAHAAPRPVPAKPAPRYEKKS